jgi:hypothetical protein
VPLFDPATGKLTDPEALRSVGFNGQGMKLPKPVVLDGKKVSPFRNEETGTIGGTTTEHGSGRVDVNVHAQAVKASASPI